MVSGLIFLIIIAIFGAFIFSKILKRRRKKKQETGTIPVKVSFKKSIILSQWESDTEIGTVHVDKILSELIKVSKLNHSMIKHKWPWVISIWFLLAIPFIGLPLMVAFAEGDLNIPPMGALIYCGILFIVALGLRSRCINSPIEKKLDSDFSEWSPVETGGREPKDIHFDILSIEAIYKEGDK